MKAEDQLIKIQQNNDRSQSSDFDNEMKFDMKIKKQNEQISIHRNSEPKMINHFHAKDGNHSQNSKINSENLSEKNRINSQQNDYRALTVQDESYNLNNHLKLPNQKRYSEKQNNQQSNLVFSYDQINQALAKYVELLNLKKKLSQQQNQDENQIRQMTIGSVVHDDLSISKSQAAESINQHGADTPLNNRHQSQYDKNSSFLNNINIQEQDESLEIGYFYLLNCDIKATEDMIRVKYLERTQEIIQNHYDLKLKIQLQEIKEVVLNQQQQIDKKVIRSMSKKKLKQLEELKMQEYMKKLEDQNELPKPIIDLNVYKDQELMRELLQVVKAFQVLSEYKSREEYIKQIRLRSFASQYMNLNAAERDGYIYPFLLFSVIENIQGSINEIGDSRMIELNFVEDTLNDRFKDHATKSYHISMVENVVKGFKYDEFMIEFQNDTKPISYFATFPLQRDFIVEMINFAKIKWKKSMETVKGINNPSNHNIQKYKQLQGHEQEKEIQPKLQLEFILEDLVLPPKGIKIGECQKKNKNFGYDKRYIMLGHSQLLIARDENFDRIVALIPLEGGFCMVKKPRDFGGLIIESTFRQYKFKFKEASDLVEWYKQIYQVAAKDFQVENYQKRVQQQIEKMQLQNVQFMYNNTLSQIESQLKDMQALLKKKQEIEQIHSERVDFNEIELIEKIKRVNFKANAVFNKYFQTNQNALALGGSSFNYSQNKQSNEPVFKDLISNNLKLDNSIIFGQNQNDKNIDEDLQEEQERLKRRILKKMNEKKLNKEKQKD